MKLNIDIFNKNAVEIISNTLEDRKFSSSINVQKLYYQLKVQLINKEIEILEMIVSKLEKGK